MLTISRKFSRASDSSPLRRVSATAAGGTIVRAPAVRMANSASTRQMAPTEPSSVRYSAITPASSSSSASGDTLSTAVPRPSRSMSRSRMSSWIGTGKEAGIERGGVQPTQQLEVSLASARIGEVDTHLMALRSGPSRH